MEARLLEAEKENLELVQSSGVEKKTLASLKQVRAIFFQDIASMFSQKLFNAIGSVYLLHMPIPLIGLISCLDSFKILSAYESMIHHPTPLFLGYFTILHNSITYLYCSSKMYQFHLQP